MWCYIINGWKILVNKYDTINDIFILSDGVKTPKCTNPLEYK